MWCEGVDWILLANVRSMAESYKHGTKHPSTINDWPSLDQFGHC